MSVPASGHGGSRRLAKRAAESLQGPRHLVIRTFKNIRRNFLFFSLYCWCTIVLWRALTGAGYEEGLSGVMDQQQQSLLSRFEHTFKLETKRAKEAAGWRFGAIWRSGHKSRTDFDSEVDPEDEIGRLIFGEPSTVPLAKPTQTQVVKRADAKDATSVKERGERMQKMRQRVQ